MPTDPFIPVTCVELSSGKATIYQDGSVTLTRIVVDLDEEETYFVTKEESFPLSQSDVAKLAAAAFSKENPL